MPLKLRQASIMNPSGIYNLICNGEEGTLELTVDADGIIINSRIDLFGEIAPIAGAFNEIDGSIEFRAEGGEDKPNPQFQGQVMTLRVTDNLAFAGIGTDYVPAMKGLAPAINRFGWWAILRVSNN